MNNFTFVARMAGQVRMVKELGFDLRALYVR
jgi:hypothetical protein